MSLKQAKKDNKLSPKYYGPYRVLQMLENYILWSNATHKICGKYKHTKHIKPERHRYTWFTQFGLRPPRTASPSFLLSSKNEETKNTTDPL